MRSKTNAKNAFPPPLPPSQAYRYSHFSIFSAQPAQENGQWVLCLHISSGASSTLGELLTLFPWWTLLIEDWLPWTSPGWVFPMACSSSQTASAWAPSMDAAPQEWAAPAWCCDPPLWQMGSLLKDPCRWIKAKWC